MNKKVYKLSLKHRLAMSKRRKGMKYSMETRMRMSKSQIGKGVKHYLSKHRLYFVWTAMLQRCDKKDFPAYKHYGGRGIKVCERWHDIHNFVEDVMPLHKEGMHMDRIDNEKGYEPGNIRFVTAKENCQNTRMCVYYTYKGMKKSMSGWADYSGIKANILRYRLRKKGMPIEEALDYKGVNKIKG